jgi:hypothetical protein
LVDQLSAKEGAIGGEEGSKAMESNYWKRHREEARRRDRTTPMPRRRRRTWRPSVIGKGESEMNYWQRQEAQATRRRQAGRRAA